MFIAAGIIISLLSSCNATKYLRENEYLYKESEVNFPASVPQGVDTNKLENELLDLNKLKQNEKVLGIFPVRTSLYMLGDRGIDQYISYQEKFDTRFFFVFDYDTLLKNIPPLADPDSKFRNWLRYTAGRAPQLVDSVLIDETGIRINNYLYNRGYFHATSSFTVGFNTDKKNAIVTYHINLGDLYKMRTVTYEISDEALARRIKQIPQKSQLQPGQPIDVELLKAERIRITQNLRNTGYYRFQKEYIFFEVDTSRQGDSLDIFVKISLPAGDSIHHPYKIRAIYVYPNAGRDYQPNETPSKLFHYIDSTRIRIGKKRVLKAYVDADTAAIADTYDEMLSDKFFSAKEKELLRSYVAQDTSANKAFYIADNGALKKSKRKKLRSDYYYIGRKHEYNQKSVGDNIFFNPNTYYSDSLIQRTVQAFSNVSIFKFVSVQADEPSDSSAFIRYLNIIIKLEPAKIKSFSAELNANTTADYLLGNALNLSYTQRNLFHYLDQVKFNIKGGIETQLAGELTYINTSELNIGLNVTIPRMGWPFEVEVPKRYFPQTTIAVNFNYIDQINDFTLYNTSFEYAVSVFENTRKKQHILKLPIPSVNIVQVPRISDAFNEELEQNLLLKQSFNEQIIVGYGYTFIYNSQAEGSKFYDQYLRASTEVNAPFSDFFRVDADFRNYVNFNRSNQFVLRVAGGFADPWRFKDTSIFNTNVIPYVKQFFVGGAYSVRAFSVRKLGPGAYVKYDTISGLRIDQVADMKLELNLEYRFDIFSPFEGALFCDFGNTWTLKKDPFRDHANLTWNFLSQIAVGPGAGIRLDLSYFIIRFDVAYPLYDPALDGPYGEEYHNYYESLGFELPKKQVTFNLAIGYPF